MTAEIRTSSTGIPKDIIDYIEAQLARKQDKELFAVELKTMRDDTQRINTIANKAVTTAESHTCDQLSNITRMSDDVMEIKNSLSNWKTIKAAGVLSLVAAILAGALFIFDMRSETQLVKNEVKSITADVAQIQDSNTRLERNFADLKVDKTSEFNVILRNLQDINMQLVNKKHN
jgi:hypothetical protein